MIAGQRKKPRFQADVPDLARSRPNPLWVGVKPANRKRKTLRFRPDLVQPRHRVTIPQRIATTVRWLRRRFASTLGERRQLWKGLTLLGVCLALIIGAFSPALINKWRALANQAPRTASGPSMPYLDAALAPTPHPFTPFATLDQHDTNPDLLSPDILASSAFVFAPEQKWLLYQKRPDTAVSMASLTKMMTLLLAVEYGSLDQKVTVGQDAAALVNGNNSAMGLSAGEELTMRDLLYGLIVASGNDAAVAIADYVGGSTAHFVVLMNRRAAQLGLSNTTFVSPDGANDANQASARDLAILAATTLQYPEVQTIVSSYHHQIPQTNAHKAYSLTSGNELLAGGHSTFPGVNGIKTGYTETAQYCIAFSASINGHLIVGVLLGDPAPGARLADAAMLLNWARTQDP